MPCDHLAPLLPHTCVPAPFGSADGRLPQGPRLTLLLPQDQHGLLGNHAVTLTPARPTPAPQPGSAALAAGTGTARSSGVGAGTPHTHAHTQPQGVTLRQVLGALHQHYTEQLPSREMAAAMAVHPRLRRTLQVTLATRVRTFL